MSKVNEFKEFKVVAISNNTNDFGLRGIILLARDGEAYQVGRSDHNGLPRLNKNDVVKVPVDASGGLTWAAEGFEIPHAMTKAPPEVIKELWG